MRLLALLLVFGPPEVRAQLLSAEAAHLETASVLPAPACGILCRPLAWWKVAKHGGSLTTDATRGARADGDQAARRAGYRWRHHRRWHRARCRGARLPCRPR